MGAKRVEIIHKESDTECIEVLKSTIIEDTKLKQYTIDKNTLLHELPEKVVNEFFDFLSGFNGELRAIALQMIKEGTMILKCTEED